MEAKRLCKGSDVVNKSFMQHGSMIMDCAFPKPGVTRESEVSRLRVIHHHWPLAVEKHELLTHMA